MDCRYLNELEGLQFVPVNSHKAPTIKGWQTSTTKHDLSNVEGVGLVCGAPSGNVQCIDIDEKYSLDGKLFDRYKAEVHRADPSLLSKLVVQRTRSGGYHLIFRCDDIAGNMKLANRPTTEEEKKATFKEVYEAELLKSTPDDKAVEKAKKAADNDKVRVLLETRGAGGQFVVEPTTGYEFIFGDLQSISQITPEEREILYSVAMQFNEVFEVVSAPKNQLPKVKQDGLSPFDDYNERGDVVGLLENHGWKVVGNKGHKTIMLRPQATSQSSGNYDHEKKWFSVFSTSTEFEPQRAYLPYAVFAIMECNGDYSEAAKRLLELGYGERKEAKGKDKAPSTRQIQSRIDVSDGDLSFLATPEDYNPYLQQVIDGTLPMGLTTGCPSLDEYFMFKKGAFVHINGLDNVGKTAFIWWLLLIAAMYHGWKGLIFSSENTIGSCMRTLIQYYWGKPLRGDFAMTQSEYQIAKTFVEKHFKIIKAQEDLYNYKDIINMAKKAREKFDLTYCMIDPYNSLKIDLSGFSKLNTHEYHYEALSELKAYGQQTQFGWFVNHHAVTAAARAKDGDKKYPVAPNKADTEGGSRVINKADEFLTIHRVTQHPTDWKITEVHVRKVKDTETGGKPSPIDTPVRFERYRGGHAFIEVLYEGGRAIDPIHEWHRLREPKQTQTPFVFPSKKEESVSLEDDTTGWKPYKEDF